METRWKSINTGSCYVASLFTDFNTAANNFRNSASANYISIISRSEMENDRILENHGSQCHENTSFKNFYRIICTNSNDKMQLNVSNSVYFVFQDAKAEF